MKTLSFILVLVALLMGCQSSHHGSQILSQYEFKPDDNNVETIELATQQAQQSDTLLMVVLGAQWCHDSTGLAAQFSTPEMQTILTERFTTVFVDVGYFEDFHHLAQRYGYPAYFGTPTVMVINPDNNQLLNRDSLPQWQRAASIELKDYRQYFQSIGANHQPESAKVTFKNPEYRRFIQQQVKRLKQGFDHLRPIWAAVRNGDTENSEELEQVATEVWEFRVQLQKDIHALYAHSNQKQTGELKLPDYEPFSWQKP